MKQLALDIAPSPEPTLDNFVPGRNAELVVALYAIAHNASHERFVYVWGGHGSGRSHLLRAVAKAARAHGIAVASFSDATAEIADGTLITVDDVHTLDAQGQIALFNLHNRVRAGGGALIASGDRTPLQLGLRADLASRLAAGLVYQTHELTDEEKGAALRRRAEERGFELSPEVERYLLRHARRDMASLLAMLEALDRYSLETRRAVTVPLLRQLLPAVACPAGAGRGDVPSLPT